MRYNRGMTDQSHPLDSPEGSKPAKPRHQNRLRILVAAHVFSWLVAVWFLLFFTLISDRNLAGSLVVGVLDTFFILFLSQVSLLGIWVGLGTSTWVWRVLGLIFGLSWLVMLKISFIAPFSEVQNIVVFLAIAAVALIFRRSVRLELPGEHKEQDQAKGLQFSILHLIALTTAVAIVLALRHVIRELLEVFGKDFNKFVTGDLIFTCCLIVTAPAIVWAALYKGRPLRRISFVLMFSFSLYLLLKIPFFYTYGENKVDYFNENIIHAASALVLQGAVVFGSLLVVRSCGYRLGRVSRES